MTHYPSEQRDLVYRDRRRYETLRRGLLGISVK